MEPDGINAINKLEERRDRIERSRSESTDSFPILVRGISNRSFFFFFFFRWIDVLIPFFSRLNLRWESFVALFCRYIRMIKKERKKDLKWHRAIRFFSFVPFIILQKFRASNLYTLRYKLHRYICYPNACFVSRQNNKLLYLCFPWTI